MKRPSCLCMQTSISLTACVCVPEATIAGLSAAWTRQRTMSAGRCAWIKLCIDSLLHCPFSGSLCSWSTSILPPHPCLHLGPASGRSRPSPLRSLCQCSFVRSGWALALCVSLYTHHVLLFTDWLCEHLRGAETEGGGTGGQWIHHGSLVHKTRRNVNKEKRFFKKRPLNCVAQQNVNCGCAVWFGRQMKWEETRRNKSRAV